MKYYIKARHNPQLGVRYTALGRMKAAEAKKKERVLYGVNIVTGYTKDEYLEKCKELSITPVL